MAQIKTRKGKQGNTYRAIIRIAGHPEVGKTFRRLGEAKAWAIETEREIRAKVYQDPRGIRTTVAQALDRYLEEITPTKARTTAARERYSAKALKDFLGSIPIADLTGPAVARYRDRRLAKVGASSVRQELAMLSSLCQIAKREWGLPIANPVNDVNRPAPPTGRVLFLDQEQATRLLEACSASRNRMLHPYIRLLLNSGMRPSEAAGLRWYQINLEECYVILEKTKTALRRRVPLNSAAVNALALIKEGKDDQDLVFLSEETLERTRGRPAVAFRTSFDNARKRAELSEIHLHDLRHTAASHLIMAGVDLRTLADILGHRTMQMVQRYTHLMEGHKLAAVEKIGL